MAKNIRETPILEGTDAELFNLRAKVNELEAERSEVRNSLLDFIIKQIESTPVRLSSEREREAIIYGLNSLKTK